MKENKKRKSKYKVRKLDERRRRLNRAPIDTKPVEDSQISIREMKSSDKYELFRIVSDFRRDYYITVYKSVFRCWFTYLLTGALLGVSLTLMRSSTIGICAPPLLVTVFLLWKVSKYKKLNRLFSVNEMEVLMQNESFGFRFKSTETRRAKQGVYLAFLKRKDTEEIYDLLNTDIDTDSDEEGSDKNEDENDDEELNKKLVGYLVYAKHSDELETVCIKEVCIDKDYRNRKIASCFIRRVCKNVFRTYGYRRVSFQVASFHNDVAKVCEKKRGAWMRKIYSWQAFNFVPGVCDERSEYSFDIDKI